MNLTYIGIALGLGLIIIGTGYGIGHVGGKAMEAMGRQPEVADKVRTTMILNVALIEGAALFALFICFLLTSK